MKVSLGWEIFLHGFLYNEEMSKRINKPSSPISFHVGECFYVCMKYEMKGIVTHLPIFVSSSISDGARLLRRQSVAITPMWSVRQQTKSMISKSSITPPTATAMSEADLIGCAGTTKSRPINSSSQIPICHSSVTIIQFLCVGEFVCVLPIPRVLFLRVCTCVGVH